MGQIYSDAELMEFLVDQMACVEFEGPGVCRGVHLDGGEGFGVDPRKVLTDFMIAYRITPQVEGQRALFEELAAEAEAEARGDGWGLNTIRND